ncbi:DoxX family protein [Neolewinella agarilytica]|uniref:DoxX-like family protein n=1 Tax=Neolewinella agarilytica TaxID=478744 RepID=A0A1H9HW94_9BACT|nr:DoxX family protein [Neolewinella agarilytica]SEQ66495.1 DoxX-like family protein [Neolewinella agarilytica]
MNYIIIALKVIVGLSILNVWLVQNKKNTRWRGGDATTLTEEFKAYGLPVWMMYAVGTLKVILALLLIISIWYPAFQFYAALGLAGLLAGSVLMHFKISDPLFKSFPAALFLTMCLIIAFGNDLI